LAKLDQIEDKKLEPIMHYLNALEKHK